MSYPLTPRAQMVTVQGHHRLATLWQITRKDGEVFRFTDHSTPITFEGESYAVAGGFTATSREALSELGVSNADIRGAITSEAITNESIRSGQFDDAEVVETLVDWLCPDVAGPLSQRVFWIGDFQYDAEKWRAELLSLASYLQHKVGSRYTRECRHELGVNDGTFGCFYTLSATGGTVSAVTSRHQFTATGATSDYGGGHLIWTSGRSSGVSMDIKTASSGAFVLMDPALAEIEVGDTFDAYPGCDQTYTRCTALGQTENFGGFVDLITDAKAYDGPLYSGQQA